MVKTIGKKQGHPKDLNILFAATIIIETNEFNYWF